MEPKIGTRPRVAGARSPTSVMSVRYAGALSLGMKSALLVAPLVMPRATSASFGCMKMTTRPPRLTSP